MHGEHKPNAPYLDPPAIGDKQVERLQVAVQHVAFVHVAAQVGCRWSAADVLSEHLLLLRMARTARPAGLLPLTAGSRQACRLSFLTECLLPHQAPLQGGASMPAAPPAGTSRMPL